MKKPKKSAKPSRKQLNADIRAALRRMFSPPEDVIFFEVAAGTGANGRRRIADAVTMGCWPSRGMKITAIEIKVNRYDWKREKINPEKAEEIAAYCDRFALVSGPGVVEPKEVPPAWDWYELNDEGFLAYRQKGFDTDAQPLDRSFVASLLRSAGKVDEAAVAAEVERRIEAAQAIIDERIERAVDSRTRNGKRAIERLEAIEGVLLGDLDSFLDDGELCQAVRMVLRSGVFKTYNGLLSLERQMSDLRASINEALKAASPLEDLPGGDSPSCGRNLDKEQNLV